MLAAFPWSLIKMLYLPIMKIVCLVGGCCCPPLLYSIEINLLSIF